MSLELVIRIEVKLFFAQLVHNLIHQLLVLLHLLLFLASSAEPSLNLLLQLLSEPVCWLS